MISSNQNERVKYWHSLQDKKNRDLYKEYIIEGEHLVIEAYKNGYLKTIIYVGEINDNYISSKKHKKLISEFSKDIFITHHFTVCIGHQYFLCVWDIY